MAKTRIGSSSFHRGDCAVPTKACARNSLTPGQPVRLSQKGLQFGAMSILNSKNGQHLRSKEIESARSPSHALGCDLNAPRAGGSSEFVIRGVRNQVGESRAISRLGLDLDC
jgi:hypothetical protein